jgi:hypothetical protein
MPDDTDEYGRTINPHFSVNYGEYKAIPHTETQRTKARLEEVAEDNYGIIHRGNQAHRIALPAKPKSRLDEVPAAVRPAEPDGKVAFLPKQGTTIDTPDVHAPTTTPPVRAYTVARPENVQMIPVDEIIQHVFRERGRLTPEQNKRIREQFRAGVSASQLSDILDMLEVSEQEIKHA